MNFIFFHSISSRSASSARRSAWLDSSAISCSSSSGIGPARSDVAWVGSRPSSTRSWGNFGSPFEPSFA